MSGTDSPADFARTEVRRLVDEFARTEVRRLVDEYCTTKRHPSLQTFTIHGPFTLDNLWESDASNGPGCYVIYGRNGSLRYIGMSLTNVGNRLGTHLSEATQRAPFWRQGSPAHSVDIIKVEQPWEAPSLEAYLYMTYSAAPESKVEGT
jgi:hypothetical protein